MHLYVRVLSLSGGSLLKGCVLGDTGVGKYNKYACQGGEPMSNIPSLTRSPLLLPRTSMCMQFFGGQFPEETDPTLEEVHLKERPADGVLLRWEILDSVW